MVFADRFPAGCIDFELYGHFVPYRAPLHHTVMHDKVSSRFLRIRNLHFHTMLESQGPAHVTDLSASFAVEWRALEHQLEALPGMCLLDLPAVHNDSNHRAGRLGGLIAGKDRGTGALQHVLIHRCHLYFPRALPGLTGFDAPTLKFRLKSFPVQVDPRFEGHLLGQIDREAKCIVELKRLGPRNAPRAVLAVLRHEDIQLAHALVQRVQEALLLAQEHLTDILALRFQFWIGAAHDTLHSVHQAIQERLLEPEHLAVTGRTPYDAPQYIAAPGVFGPHPVAQQEHAGTHMVRDDAHGHIVGFDAAVRFFGELFHRRDDGAEQVRIIVALHPLHDRRNALQTHASVDVLLGQRGERAIRGAAVLHKD